jgi:hypothetical protein
MLDRDCPRRRRAEVGDVAAIEHQCHRFARSRIEREHYPAVGRQADGGIAGKPRGDLYRPASPAVEIAGLHVHLTPRLRYVR